MLGRRSPQQGLFEADALYREFVGRTTFYGWLADQRGELFRDEDFAELYARGWGRPSVPPSLLATALVLQTYAGVSDDEAVQRAAYDLRWKVALGIDLDARPFAKSTLQEFRAQLVVHAEQRALFQASLELAKRRGKLARHRKLTVALDTTPILGRGAVKDTYNLLADGIVAVLRVLARQAGVRRGDGAGFAAWARAAGYARYVGAVSVKGGAAIDWDDPAARARFLAEVVADADRVLERARVARGTLGATSAADTALVEATGLLSRVLCQDVERPAGGPAIRRGTAPDRLVSVHDPEMRHGRKSATKRFDGHKAAVAVDTDEQRITAVDVLAANAPDAEDALDLTEQTEGATGCPVAETQGDCAYGAGETRQAFAAVGRTLRAKVPSVTNGGCFPKTAFAIDLAAGTCTCPGGQTTRALRPNGDRQAFQFATAACAACPLRAQCLQNPARPGGRTIAVHAQEGLLQQARAFQASPAFDAVRRRRQTAEHRIARLVQLGIRQARYHGRAKTLFQVAMAAAVANLTLLAAADATPPAAAAPMVVLGALIVALATLLVRQAPATGRAVAPRPVTDHRWRHAGDPVRRCLRSASIAAFRPDF
jgi:transposase